MIYQAIDNITFRMKEEHDFSFLKKYGSVFKVFDGQDSGNICFGVRDGERRLFVKFAGAQTAEYDGSPADAAERLRSVVSLYRDIKSEKLIKFVTAEEIGGGFALVFEWTEGKCMARMYPDDHRFIMDLSVQKKLLIFSDIIAFMDDIQRQGYQAIDFYDGSIMFDDKTNKTTICDIDFFRKKPCVNNMGRMWGSARFLSPEEYVRGETLDEITNVFTLGKMGFSLFTDSDEDFSAFPLSRAHYDVLRKASGEDRADRYPSVKEFSDAWHNA